MHFLKSILFPVQFLWNLELTIGSRFLRLEINARNRLNASWTRIFFIFCIFFLFLKIFPSPQSLWCTWKIIKNGRKRRKAFLTFVQPFTSNPNPDFWKPDPSQFTFTILIHIIIFNGCRIEIPIYRYVLPLISFWSNFVHELFLELLVITMPCTITFCLSM